MKKGRLLHPEISQVIAKLGHFDTLTIADAGLPIPQGPIRIDLALSQGVPTFQQVTEVITSEVQIQSVHLAQEVVEHNPPVHQQLLSLIALIAAQQGQEIEIVYVPHETFKALTRQSKAIVRSGECSPYANAIFTSGVTF